MFVAVLETGSFSRAAERLGTSSGQASKMVAGLESELGVRLIHRTTRALSATELGQAYLEGIRPLLEELDGLDAAMRDASGRASGRLRLSVPVSFGTHQVAPLLIDFAAAFPGIGLDVQFSDRLASLADDGFDAAIRVGRPADASLIARRLCDARVVLAASPAYLAAHGAPRAPAELAGHACIIDTNFREPALWRFRAPPGTEGGGAAQVAVRGRLSFSNAESCLAAAVAGLGIARVPSFIAGPAFRRGEVRPVLGAFEDAPLGVHVLYPPGRHLARKVRVLVDFLVARLGQAPPWDLGWDN